jgi:hypothetical protein
MSSVYPQKNIIKYTLAFLVIVLSFFFVSPASASTIIQRPLYVGLTNGLVGSWSFDGGDIMTRSNIALDRSGQGNNGTLTNGATTTKGKIGQGLSFDGVNDVVILGTDSVGSNTVTICAWMNTRSLSTWQFIASNNAFLFGPYNVGNNNIVVSSNGGGTILVSANNSISINQWYHVCVVRLSSGIGTIFINGSQSGASGTTGSPSAGDVLGIGDRGASTQLPFNGQIDDVRIYNRALGADEIKRLYKIGGTFTVNKPADNSDTSLGTGLVGYWSFDGADMNATKALDQSGNANNGTLTNGPTRAKGKLGQGLSFDGVNDYVAVSDGTPIQTLGPLTYSAWIRPSSFGGASKGRIVQKNVSGSSLGNRLLSINNSDITKGLSFTARFSSLPVQNYSSNNVITLNTWQHVVVTWDGTTDRTHINYYVNGVLTGRQDGPDGQDGSGSVNSDAGCAILIGAQGGGGSDCNLTDGTRQFDGQIDDVRVYNRALTAQEVNRLYNMGR